jgi:Protein of unknown function (DUF3703)
MLITPEQAQIVVPRLLAQQATLSNVEQRWQLLSAAHVAGQYVFRLHWLTHVAMWRCAASHSDYREVAGQTMRLTLTLLGHLTQRLPHGNPGRATVNAFQPMAVSPETRRLIFEALQPV